MERRRELLGHNDEGRFDDSGIRKIGALHWAEFILTGESFCDFICKDGRLASSFEHSNHLSKCKFKKYAFFLVISASLY